MPLSAHPSGGVNGASVAHCGPRNSGAPMAKMPRKPSDIGADPAPLVGGGEGHFIGDWLAFARDRLGQASLVLVPAEVLRANAPSMARTCSSLTSPMGCTSDRRILFAVSVPVLSMQKMLTFESDSTAFVPCTSASWLARRTAPME